MKDLFNYRNREKGAAPATGRRPRALFVTSIITMLVLVTTAAASVTFILKWGTAGAGDGEFYGPSALAADASGNIYLVDNFNHRIEKFDSNGNFLSKWGSFGTGNGEFYYPYGIALDASGKIYVADANNHRIQKFDLNGNFITKWGSPGTGDGQFNFPVSLSVGLTGAIYVVDTYNNRIQKFDLDGNFLGKWGTLGAGDGEFFDPLGVATDPTGDIYVTDQYNQRVQKFDSDGNFITKWGSLGLGDGQFYNPDCVAVDSAGNVYIADQNANRVQKFDSNGGFIEKWGTLGSGDGEFDKPYSIAVDSFFNVYVGELQNTRVQKFGQPGLNGGWLTGGGWINSPAGSLTANTLLTGKATFGFVSKYEHGTTTATGQTEFQLKMGNLNFHSSSYDWLMVTGARAQYMGSGSINGQGDYGFMLTALDGQMNGCGGTDKIRMKIWDKGSGAVIYDSQMGASNQANPTTDLGGGSVVIHQ